MKQATGGKCKTCDTFFTQMKSITNDNDNDNNCTSDNDKETISK